MSKIVLDTRSISGRICGVDFGLKRIGLALTDELKIIVKPEKIIYFAKDKMVDEFVDFIKSFQVSLAVIGYPKKNSQSSSSTNQILLNEIDSFISETNKIIDLEFIKIDESYTSKLASKMILESGKKKNERRKKENIDLFAAAIILQNFLEENQ